MSDRVLATETVPPCNPPAWLVAELTRAADGTDEIADAIAEVAQVASVRGGYAVRPHVQAFATALLDAVGVSSFGTYAGHDPTPDRALDIFVPVGDRSVGDAVCEFALANFDRFGLWYVIFRQEIYNPSIAGYWRAMADRGSLTANHFDHVHISFEAEAPEPLPEEDFLAALSDDEQRELLEGIRQVRSDATFLKDLAARLVAGSGDSPDYYGDAIRTHALIEQAAARGDGNVLVGWGGKFTITGTGDLKSEQT